jgi:hypothetical protein
LTLNSPLRKSYHWYERRQLSAGGGDHRCRSSAPLELGGEGADRGREPRSGDHLLGGGAALGLHASQLFAWRQQLQRSPSASEAIGGPAFVPVLAMEDDPAPAESVGRMEIAFGPAVVRAGADVDAAALRRVLEVVRSLT